LDISRLRANTGESGRGLYILAAGELRDNGRQVSLLGEEFPVLWADLPDLLVTPHNVYDMETELVKVLYIAAEGITRLGPRKQVVLRTALIEAGAARSEGAPTAPVQRLLNTAVDAEPEFDVFLCHSALDLRTVDEIARRLQAMGISYWLDNEQIAFGDSLIGRIERGLRKSRYLVPCISANWKTSKWAAAEYVSVLHAEISGRPENSVIPLVLDNHDDAIPLLLRDRRRVTYTDEAEFTAFLQFLSDRHNESF
jgi:hypothetical protein